MRNWKKIITKDATVILKSLLIESIAAGPRYIVPEWNGFKNHLWIFKNDEAIAYYVRDEVEEFAKIIRDKAVEDGGFAKRYREESKKMIDAGVAGTEALSRQAHSGLSNSELQKLFLGFCSNFRMLSDTIVMTLEELDAEAGAELANPADLITLATPPELSVEAQEELDRIILIEKIQRVLPNLLKKSVSEIVLELERHPELKSALVKHVEAYEWIPLNFAKPVWDVEFFVGVMKTYVEGGTNLSVRKHELLEHSAKHADNRRKLLSTLNTKTQRLCNMLEAASFIRFFRNSMFSRTYFAAFPILREVASRLGVSLETLAYFTPSEISEALKNNKTLLSKVGLSRKQSFVMRVLNGTYGQYEGGEAEQVAEEECPTQDVGGVTVVRGRCAYPGNIRGIVRIIRDAREMDRIEVGCVMVCKETNPDIVLAMSRAGAIVTDEGGVTSHAAIVSREMKKPCVIGTRIATKVFKDGDTVDVDAEKGVVSLVR